MTDSNRWSSDISADDTPTFMIDSGRRYRRVSGPTRRSTKGGWTREEDKLLMNAVDKYKGNKNWKKIAESFPWRKEKRNDVQCKHRWLKVLDPNLNKGPWSKEEDNLLSEMVKVYLKDDKPRWSKISKGLPGRIGKQCRERWHNHLNPSIRKTPWTREEEVILVNAQTRHGNKWAEIAKLLRGRTENNIKNHWNCSVKKRLGGVSSNLSNKAEKDSLDLTLGPMNFWKAETPSSWPEVEAPRQSSNESVYIEELNELRRRLRMAASSYKNTPSIISRRRSAALPSSEEEHSPCVKRKPMERRLEFDFL